MIFFKKALCCFLTIFLISNVFIISAEEKELLIDNCNEFDNINTMSSSKISIEDFYKKEGTGSLKITESGAFIIAQFVFEKPINILLDLKPDDLYLEFWLYVSNDAVLNGKPSQMELSSSEETDMDEYAWELTKYKYNKGWNRISLKLSDASKLGNPDLSKIIRLRFYSVVKARAAVYLDEIIITNSPRVISNDQLGTMSIGEISNNTVYQYTDFNTQKLNKAKADYKKDVLFNSIAIILFCLSTIYIIFVLIKKRKTTKTKGEH